MAGHKGNVMGVMIDILSGVLSGSKFLDGVHGPYDPVNPSGAGHFLMSLDIESFQPREHFQSLVEEYVEKIKSVPLAAGSSQIYFPGEKEKQSDSKNREQGLALPVETLESLARVARQAGLEASLPY